jgi:predicted enzyme related to lactoylglutathione lyase
MQKEKNDLQILKIVTPIYVNNLEHVLPFYEQLLQTKVGTRFHSAEKQLDIAVVGQLLLISGTDEALEAVRDITVSFLVDDIHAYKTWLLDNGAVIRQDITKVPTGYNMIVQQPDGTVIEYVEHTRTTHVE